MTFSELKPVEGLVGPMDITNEEWREYNWNDRIYTIDAPVGLYYRKGGSTHRVVDVHGITHCVPAPGEMGCVLKWCSNPEVNF